MSDEASPTGQLQDEREPHAARENTVNLESATWVPLRWPAEWRDASLLEPVGGSPPQELKHWVSFGDVRGLEQGHEA